MNKFAVIKFREAEHCIDALISPDKRLEVDEYEIYTNLADANEKRAQCESEGIEAIVLSETMLVDLATRIIW